MVEDIEHFDAELCADPLRKPNILEYREVHVEKTGSDNLVSSQIADEIRACSRCTEAPRVRVILRFGCSIAEGLTLGGYRRSLHRYGEAGRIQILQTICFPIRVNGIASSYQIRIGHVGVALRPDIGVPANDWSERRTSLGGYNGTHLPSAQDFGRESGFAANCGNRIDEADDPALRYVEVTQPLGQTVIEVKIIRQRILERVVERHIRTGVLTLRPGVAALKLQAMAQLLCDAGLKPMIPAVVIPKTCTHATDIRIEFRYVRRLGCARVDREQVSGWRQRRKLVVHVVRQIGKMNAPRSHVA